MTVSSTQGFITSLDVEETVSVHVASSFKAVALRDPAIVCFSVDFVTKTSGDSIKDVLVGEFGSSVCGCAFEAASICGCAFEAALVCKCAFEAASDCCCAFEAASVCCCAFEAALACGCTFEAALRFCIAADWRTLGLRFGCSESYRPHY